MRLALALSLALLLAGVATSSAAGSRRTKLVGKIDRLIDKAQARQQIMGVGMVKTQRRYRHQGQLHRLKRAHRIWARRAHRVWKQYRHPPHESGWWCIHRGEGAWNSNTGNGFYGGLQMDRGFMGTYAPRLLLRKGLANVWKPLEQMWVAERAHRSGRGYGPWPNTARACGLL